jgi:hypothetical protein
MSMNPLQWIVLSAAAAAGIGYFIRLFIKITKTWYTFIDDWYGSEEKPGIVERLNDGQDHFNKIDTELATIKAELFNNGGSSLRDAIDRIEKNTSK